MTPHDFIHKWGPGGPAFGLNEEQGAQSHFLDLCELLEVTRPGSEAGYVFEEKNALIGGRTGYADVFRRGSFAWENKAPGKNLGAALRQLQSYSLALYYQRPAWLAAAHAELDAAVALAYGWADYGAAMPDEEILKRLLALKLARAGVGAG